MSSHGIDIDACRTCEHALIIHSVGSTIFGERPQKDPKAKEEVVLVNSTLT